MIATNIAENTFMYMYSYCKDCKCWHSKYDKCTDVQRDRANKDNKDN